MDRPKSRTHCGFLSPLSSFSSLGWDVEVEEDEDGAWPMSARPPLLAVDAAVAAMTGLGMEAKGRGEARRKDGERRQEGATAKARSKGKVQNKAAAVVVTRRVDGGRGRRMYTCQRLCVLLWRGWGGCEKKESGQELVGMIRYDAHAPTILQREVVGASGEGRNVEFVWMLEIETLLTRLPGSPKAP